MKKNETKMHFLAKEGEVQSLFYIFLDWTYPSICEVPLYTSKSVQLTSGPAGGGGAPWKDSGPQQWRQSCFSELREQAAAGCQSAS